MMRVSANQSSEPATPEAFALLASELAGRLIKPGIFDEGLASGVFIFGCDCGDAALFASHFLAPALEALGPHVVEVSANEVLAVDSLLQVRKLVRGDRKLHMSNLPAEILSTVREEGRTVVMLLDEAESVAHTREGERLMCALKASRDVVNLSHGAADKFILVASCASAQTAKELVDNPSQAFYGASAFALPPRQAEIKPA